MRQTCSKMTITTACQLNTRLNAAGHANALMYILKSLA